MSLGEALPGIDKLIEFLRRCIPAKANPDGACGNIVRNLDGDSLRDAIFGLFYRPQKPKKAKKIKSKEMRTSIVPEIDDEEELAAIEGEQTG